MQYNEAIEKFKTIAHLNPNSPNAQIDVDIYTQFLVLTVKKTPSLNVFSQE